MSKKDLSIFYSEHFVDELGGYRMVFDSLGVCMGRLYLPLVPDPVAEGYADECTDRVMLGEDMLNLLDTTDPMLWDNIIKLTPEQKEGLLSFLNLKGLPRAEKDS